MSAAMRSVKDILCMVVDGEINTREEAAAILGEESPEYAAQLRETLERAADKLCTPRAGKKLRELFERRD